MGKEYGRPAVVGVGPVVVLSHHFSLRLTLRCVAGSWCRESRGVREGSRRDPGGVPGGSRGPPGRGPGSPGCVSAGPWGGSGRSRRGLGRSLGASRGRPGRSWEILGASRGGPGRVLGGSYESWTAAKIS